MKKNKTRIKKKADVFAEKLATILIEQSGTLRDSNNQVQNMVSLPYKVN